MNDGPITALRVSRTGRSAKCQQRARLEGRELPQQAQKNYFLEHYSSAEWSGATEPATSGSEPG
jgi:hypothetical protein